MKNGFVLWNTFSDCEISKHKTLENAVRADIAFGKAFKKKNTDGSYLPREIRVIEENEIRSLNEQEESEEIWIIERLEANQ